MSTATTIIRPTRGWSLRPVFEALRAGDLLWFLTWRDIRVRYRQTLIGGAWALIEPFVSVIVFTLLFHGVARLDSGETPYVLFTYAAMVGWNFVARSLRDVSKSMVSNAPLLRKIYFPRLVLPLSALGVCVVDFACGLVMYGVLMLYFGLAPSWAILTIPLWLALATLSVFGVGLILAAINVRWRDVTQAVPFLIQTWMLASPVAYPLSAIPEQWRTLYSLNPMVGVAEGFRWALLPNHNLDPAFLIPTIVVGGVATLAGLLCFVRSQRDFADVV